VHPSGEGAAARLPPVRGLPRGGVDGRTGLRRAGGRYGSGAGSRSSPPTRPGPRERSAATASGSLRAQLARIPNAIMVTTIEVPPAEMSGSVMPVTGSNPTT
jgi:hypothetical protein